MSLASAMQPGLVSPDGSDQAIRYHPASHWSESRESLRHVAATPSRVCGEADRSMVKRNPCAGDAPDPPLWIVDCS